MNKITIMAVASSLFMPALLAFANNDGGMVKLAGKGQLAVVDCRSGIDWDQMKPVFKAFDQAFHVQVVHLKDNAFSVETASAAVAKTKSNAALFVGNINAYPMSLSAPEAKWAFVNVAPLHKDNKNFVKRCSVLLMRGIYRALGSDTSSAPKSCLTPIHSPSDLDEISDLDVAMDTYMSVCQSLESLGIVPIEYGSYQDACEMGVAPAPTNDIQKAIWDKVHQLPTKPLVIKPESQRKTK